MAEDIGSKKGVYNTERFKRKRPEAEQSSASNDVEEDDYFQRTSLLVYIVVLFGMITFEARKVLQGLNISFFKIGVGFFLISKKTS